MRFPSPFLTMTNLCEPHDLKDKALMKHLIQIYKDFIPRGVIIKPTKSCIVTWVPSIIVWPLLTFGTTFADSLSKLITIAKLSSLENDFFLEFSRTYNGFGTWSKKGFQVSSQTRQLFVQSHRGAKREGRPKQQAQTLEDRANQKVH